jgi:hypothetical protein
MKTAPPHSLPGINQFSQSKFIPFGRKPWSTSKGGQIVSSDEHGLYFEGQFEASFKNSVGGFLLLRSFRHSDVSIFVRRFLFLAESITILAMHKA